MKNEPAFPTEHIGALGGGSVTGGGGSDYLFQRGQMKLLSGGLTKLEYAAIHAPFLEIESMIGSSVNEAAQFLGITTEEYNKDCSGNWLRGCTKAREMWAKTLFTELEKEQ